MNVLFVVWELDPFIKVGGLGDVARSLPTALIKQGVDIHIVIPYYKALKLGNRRKELINNIKVDYAGKKEKVEIWKVLLPECNIPVYLLRNQLLFMPDFPDTFALFNKTIVLSIKENYLNWTPDIIHCNDLHAALIPLLLKEYKLPIKTILTIHNLSYQGKTSTEVLDKLGIDKSKSRIVRWEIKSRNVNFLMEGIMHADIVTTVSPNYAREIMTEEFGCGLENILIGKRARVFGILNGIDDNWRDILHQKHTHHPYLTTKKQSWEHGKDINKLQLQKKLGLKVGKSIPLISFIGRMDPNQKGIDILHKMLRRIDPHEYEFVILGTGDIHWEERFLWLSKFYPNNISCNFKFNEKLANQIYAASDFILVPSKFEPCGLIPMIAMYMGTIPIAHKTGGLADSIKDGYNGFLFEKQTSDALKRTIKRAVDIWKNQRPSFRKMVENALSTNFSWKKSATEYLSLYTRLIGEQIYNT